MAKHHRSSIKAYNRAIYEVMVEVEQREKLEESEAAATTVSAPERRQATE